MRRLHFLHPGSSETLSLTFDIDFMASYYAFHDVRLEGRVEEIDLVYKYLILDGNRIYFDDIYDIKICDI